MFSSGCIISENLLGLGPCESFRTGLDEGFALPLHGEAVKGMYGLVLPYVRKLRLIAGARSR